jgi:hypothetical protein
MARNRLRNRPKTNGVSQHSLNGQTRTVVSSPAGKQVDISRKPSTGLYQPIPHIWFQHPTDLPPFTFSVIRAMLMDEGIRLNFATRSAPLYGLEFGWEENGQWQEGVKCRDQAVSEYIYRQIQRIWKTFLPEIIRAQIWGWSAGEVTIKLSEDTGLVEINEMLSRHPMDCKLLKNGCERWGVRIERVTGGSVDLPFPYSWFHSYGAEDGEDYGTSAAYGAYSPWADKWLNGGAKDVRRLFMHKDAYGGADLGYPEGETFIQGQETPVPNRDIARNIVEQLRAGGVTTRPSERDENGNEKWPLTRASVASNPQHILQYPQDLDAEIRHGMEICDDVINSDATGAWAGKKIPMQAFYATLDVWAVRLLKDICKQLIDPLLVMNFGKVLEYETPFKPLAKQAMEQQGEGDGGDPNAGAMDGMQLDQNGMPQTGIPGQSPEQQAPQPPQQQQPIGMSLAEQIGRGDISATEIAAECQRVVRLSVNSNAQNESFSVSEDITMPLVWILTSDEIEQVKRGAKTLVRMDDAKVDKAITALSLLSEENATLRMSLDSTGHEHRGKGKGGGQFVSKGGGSDGDSNPTKPSEAKPGPAKSQGDTQKQASAPSGTSQGQTTDKPTKDVPGTKIDSEPTTAPPPGKSYSVNVEDAGPNGVSKAARVGVPGDVVPPPPGIPKLPNLTSREREVEDRFRSAFMENPAKMANQYRELVYKQEGTKAYTFEVDQAKCFSDDWMDEDKQKQMTKRQTNNNALHQTANAVVKRAFLDHLDTLKPGDNVLVTVGGCGSGKGYTLKNTELGKNLGGQAKAIWDSAGDQNATENPWILAEAEKRGLNVTYAYVAGDPKVSWADPGRGVVTRAHDPNDGRMVDAAVFADSYVLGAKNHHAFHQANLNNKNAKFLFFNAKDQSVIDGVPPESLKVDRKSLYHWAMGSIQSRTDVSPAVMRGATQGARIWNEEFN